MAKYRGDQPYYEKAPDQIGAGISAGLQSYNESKKQEELQKKFANFDRLPKIQQAMLLAEVAGQPAAAAHVKAIGQQQEREQFFGGQNILPQGNQRPEASQLRNAIESTNQLQAPQPNVQGQEKQTPVNVTVPIVQPNASMMQQQEQPAQQGGSKLSQMSDDQLKEGIARFPQVAPALEQELKDRREARNLEKKDEQILRKERLDIHKMELPVFNETMQQAESAKKALNARKIMREQIQSGKLSNKNFKNLLANVFKNTWVEGLLSSPEREVFKSAGITQYEGMKDMFGTRLSDADLAVASAKVMDPTKSPEANLAIADFWDFNDRMKEEKAKVSREVKKINNGFLPINWNEQVDEIMQERFGDEAERVVKNAATEGGTRPFKVIDGKVAMISADGKRKLIPQEFVKDAMLAGGIPE